MGGQGAVQGRSANLEGWGDRRGTFALVEGHTCVVDLGGGEGRAAA
jgi:hypothetical protein